MRTIYSKFDKAAIQSLPVVQFQGRVIVIQTAGEADRAVDYLMQFPRLGIDTETRPNFKPGGMNPVALLQVSTPDTCFLFRLNRFGLTDALVRLFTSERIQKVGLSLHDDWTQLRKRKDFKPVNFIELQDYVKPLGVVDMSLQKLYANFFGQKISKTQRLTNWEADVLTEAQKRYAATDAWTCLRLYDIITELFNTHAYRLVLVPEPETSKS
ncbi:MAG: 3'-5' exonuclease domain-containing protein 2 [Bacteroidaceae bacterium]|nr:3'-5' exonuclease domain-containing protein 2 [Bacteroidaceae bacterium]MBQ8936547.1 3'-5' exonuclease domain-containing protein 2 [Bacteroidaceae bacterium]MBR0243208.1 3'-5' exonuclease domain-containing protein 2 [Bacteroidaceae bacterium]MBR1665211.1 3'-5' exonuclease domain-containing protein 2 [Bacteroidaceae bacterium]MBR1790194.1 3'-5' exonuclease domain-containing protein 2 [Bacteroidaceae bacterium]